MPKKYNNPLDLVADNPRMALIPNCAYGAVWRFVALWWRAGCPELIPEFDYQTVSGMRLRNWVHHKAAVLSIIEEIAPPLMAMYQHKTKTRQIRNKALILAHDAVRMKAMKKKLQRISDNQFITDEKDNHIGVVAIPISHQNAHKDKKPPKPAGENLLFDR